MREIALDTETTGFNTKDGDRIVEIGCVEIIDKKITGNRYHVYINPQRELSRSSIEIIGLDSDFFKKFDTFDKVVQDFLDFIRNDRLVIHNAKFDIGFLNYELDRINLSALQNDIVDTLTLAKRKYPGSPATLDALCRKFKVDSSKRTKHGASIDAELLASVYICMSVEMEQKDIFGSNSEIANNEIITYARKKKLNDRGFQIDQNDYQNHQLFLKKIKNSLWETC